MKVYVETNFLLELALVQHENAACESLLAHAERAHIAIAMPACAIVEARIALENKRRHVSEFFGAYDRHVRGQLSRIANIGALRDSRDALFRELTSGLEEAESRYVAASRRIRALGGVIAMTADAIEFAEGRSSGLDYNDALVFAAIASDADYGQADTCFVTRDRDFAGLAEAMRSARCTVLRSFEDLRAKIEATLPPR